MTINKKRFAVWGIVALVTALVIGEVAWRRVFHHYPPKAVMKDLKAAMAARHSARPLDTYLEARYGSMTNAANREAAFVDFFNVDHVKGLNFLVTHMPPEMREANIKAMADWVSNYRQTMTDQERQDLRQTLSTPEGVAMIRKAGSEFLREDIHYRAANAQVITELMTTLTTIQQQ